MNINYLKNLIKKIIVETMESYNVSNNQSKKMIYEKNSRKKLKNKKWIKKALHPSRSGMFKDISITDIKKEINDIKRKNKARKSMGKKVSYEDRKRMGQLLFALRAKRNKI